METTVVRKVVGDLIRCTECSNKRLFKKICFEITVKCSFAAYGCQFTGNGMEVFVHEAKGHCRDSTIEASNLYQSSVISMEEAILAELQCPVCYTCIKPPIMQCLNDHSLCNDCTELVQICPICRGPKAVEINLILGYICRIVDVPCRNASYGCTMRGKGDDVALHEKFCKFCPRLCPLNDHEECRWSGLTTEIADHCRLQHSDKLYIEHEHKWDMEGFMSNMFLINLFYTYGVLFKCVWYIRGDNVMFSLNYIQDEPFPGRFKYEIKLCLPGTANALAIVESECAHLNDGGFQCVGYDSVLVPSKLINSYKDKGRDIIFVLNIFDGKNKTPQTA